LIQDAFGKLYNDANELVAEGSCQIDHERGVVNMRPVIDSPLMERQHGTLRLDLDDGTELGVTDQIIRFRLNAPGVPPGPSYRLTFTNQQRLASNGG
jgi:hypothetical protein